MLRCPPAKIDRFSCYAWIANSACTGTAGGSQDCQFRTSSWYDDPQADAPSRPKGLSGVTPGQHDELTKHRMSLAARYADQLTQSQTRWSIRCVPFRVTAGNFSLWPVHFFI